MSQSIIFSVGSVVFLMTVWGSVMAAGIALGRVQEAEHEESSSGAGSDDRPTPEQT